MDPTEVWAAIQELVQGMQTIEYLLGITKTQTKKAAQENVPFTIETSSAISAAAISDHTIGLAAISTDISDGFTAVLAAITAVQQAADPVNLPAVPPTGYGAPSSSDNANEVWNYHINPFGDLSQDLLNQAGQAGGYMRSLLNDYPTSGYFLPRFRAADFAAGVTEDTPTFDPTDVLPSESVLDNLTRQNPGRTCSWAIDPNGQVLVSGDISFDVWQFYTTFDQAGFDAIRLAALGSGGTATPPVWPGIDAVTFGSDVVITPLTTIDAPMDGIVIAIEAVTVNKPAIPYGDQEGWRYLGGIAFVSDNGQVEPWQVLTFKNALYCPTSMARAAGVVIRADASIVGTVTPWSKA